ncbi:MAG: dihydrodipicolinate synthase family protein [Saprospiraceae bacterium]|nr:dihydrodipicolinate synthase family protein [Saprospiraceae bacterium]
MKKLEGLIAATYTPFDEKGHVNLNIIPFYAQYLKNMGVRGVFVNGTTGEGPSLTLEERMEVAAAWTSEHDDHFHVLVHVGHNSLPSAQRLVKHASEVGADGIGCMAPTFFKPHDILSLTSCNAELASVAPHLPYYYYHIPSMTGINLSMIDFLHSAEERIPNLAGIKFTYEDLMDLQLCLEYGNRKYDILFGRDEILLAGLSLGASGAVGSTYNYLAPLFIKLISAFHQGELELAKRLQFEAVQIIEVLIRFGGGVQGGKAIMQTIGLDLGGPRLPLLGLPSFEVEKLVKELESTHFEEHTVKI